MTPTLAPDRVWSLLLALRRHVREAATVPARCGLRLDPDGQPAVTPAADPAALLEIAADAAWTARTPLAAASAELLDLYLPMALAGPGRPLTVAHLGQSLDGRIATANGVSRYVTGPENLTHLHRMRAVCDAVVVGAGTVECDDPQLTTRRVVGPHPVRVVLDPRRRLAADHGLFHDRTAPTLLVCAEGRIDQPAPGEAELVGVPMQGSRLNPRALLQRLWERRLFAIFIEGGGLTVSAFLEQGLLDRLQITVAPLIIGSGRPGVTLPAIADLSQGLRPRHRRYLMGEDVLFDCRLRDGPGEPMPRSGFQPT
ncbi:MAG: RibD family protein [Candidatus Contendobacter sp.]|nr:RibD family protein [Candidatus Contendobacter sp.]MDG4558713.1 RibD family protein [Candidatus Contendobacter sp.]